MCISYYNTPSESTRRKKTYGNVTNNVIHDGKIINIVTNQPQEHLHIYLNDDETREIFYPHEFENKTSFDLSLNHLHQLKMVKDFLSQYM